VAAAPMMPAASSAETSSLFVIMSIPPHSIAQFSKRALLVQYDSCMGCVFGSRRNIA
jgi:hypothetical protein